MKFPTNILVFVFVLTSLQLHGQQFIDTTSTWYATRFLMNSSGESVWWFYSYSFSGTKIIDTKIYHNLLVTGTDSLQTEYGILEAGKYFRTEGERTYFKIEAEESEYLLHDFGASVGDTLIVGKNDEQVVVIGVDSITLLNGDIRKRIKVEGWNLALGYFDQDWIEGIGSTSGPMNWSAGLATFYDLKCFMRGDVTEYSEGECSITAIESPINKTEVRLFPNPVVDVLNIDIESINLPMDVSLYSMAGQLVYDIMQVTYGQIDLSQLASGAYMMLLRDSEKRTSVHTIVKL